MTDTTNTPFRDNEYVRELLSIMEQNRMDTADLRGLIGYVGAMERQLNNAVGELQTMRRELSGMREEQNHPVRTALQNTIHSMENTVSDARERLDAIKKSLIDGCKNAVTAFKENGISAIGNIASFLHIKGGLQNMRDSLNRGIKNDERAIAAIEGVSAGYHEAGRRIKNVGRALSDKEAVRDARSSGKLAKALEAPFRAEMSAIKDVRRCVESAIGKLEQLERAGAKCRAAERKPSILKSLQAFKEQSAQTKREVPAADKVKKKEASL